MSSFVCPKCLDDEIVGICDYTKQIIHREEGKAICEIDWDGDVTDYLDFEEASTEEDYEEDPDVDDSDVNYRCKSCEYESTDIEEFQGGRVEA